MSNRTIEAILRVSAKLGNVNALRTLQRQLDQVNRQATAFNRANNFMARRTRDLWASTARFVGPAAIAYGLKESTAQFAAVERRLNRIAINAGKGRDAATDMLKAVNRTANDYALARDDVTTGLETLVASGRELEDAMAFLPSVSATAQAAGADIADIATTADAVANSFGIAGDRMQGAFDILVASGKQGKFELKDMAQYLPTLAPAFAAMGYEGEKGLGKLASILQTIRIRTGDASEAATSAQNIFQKMESEETVNKFAKFGVNLRKEMAAARKEGRDLVDAFLDLTEKATKGDLSKIPQIFTDAQFQVGMRALLQGRKDMEGFQQALANVDGSTLRDLGQILSDNQTKIDRMKSSWDRLMTSVGEGAVNLGAVGAMDYVASSVDYAGAVNAGLEKRGVKGFWARSLWGIRNDQAAKDEMAFVGGYRTPEQSRQIRDYGAYAVARAGAGATSNATAYPVPIPRPSSGASVLPDLGAVRGVPPRLATASAAAFGDWKSDVGRSPPARSFRESENKSMSDYGRDYGYLRDEIETALATGGEKAGSSIEAAAEAVNRAGGEAGSAFARMLDGIGQRLGEQAAASFRANVGTVTVKAQVQGAGMASGNKGVSMPDAGRSSYGGPR